MWTRCPELRRICRPRRSVKKENRQNRCATLGFFPTRSVPDSIGRGHRTPPNPWLWQAIQFGGGTRVTPDALDEKYCSTLRTRLPRSYLPRYGNNFPAHADDKRSQCRATLYVTCCQATGCDARIVDPDLGMCFARELCGEVVCNECMRGNINGRRIHRRESPSSRAD